MPQLTRAIGLPHATAIVVGIIIGASVFVQASEITARVPSLLGVTLAWVVAGLLTMGGALVCAELSSAFPRTGGVYVFLRETYSPAVGFLWGWAMFWSMHTGIAAAIATVFARYAGYFVPMSDGMLRLVAVGAILLLSIVNYLGVRFGSGVQTAITAVKVVAVAGIILAGWLLHPAAPIASSTAAAAAGGAGDFLLAVGAGLFAFGGWHMVTYAAEETRNPERTIPRALMLGTAVVVVTYLALNAAYLLVLPFSSVLTSTHIAFDATLTAAGPTAASAISVLVIVSSLGANSGIILAGPRVYYAMAEDGSLFRFMGRLHPTHHTPYIAIVAQAIWSSVLVLTGTYGTLVSRVVYTEWIFFGALALGLMRLRRSRGYTPAFRAAGFPAAPLLFAAICFVMVINVIVSDPFNGLWGLGLVVLGLPAYVVWRRLHAGHRLP
jgi:APA family basic amino acid/polyamine antiporter